MIARDFASSARGLDRGFISRQRAMGRPDAAIAKMGGWYVGDVEAVPHEPALAALTKPKPAPGPVKPPPAMEIPEVAEILRHVAEQYDVTPADILGHSHAPEAVEPRHEAMAVVFELNRYTLSQLASIFDKTNNGVIYGLRRHYDRLRHRGPGRDW